MAEVPNEVINHPAHLECIPLEYRAAVMDLHIRSSLTLHTNSYEKCAHNHSHANTGSSKWSHLPELPFGDAALRRLVGGGGK